MIVSLLQNAALLITISVFYGMILRYRPASEGNLKVLLGLWFGVSAILVMLMPFTYEPGIFYDARSIVITLAAFWGGSIPAIISIVIAGVFRAIVGGPGIWAGIATILFCGLTGLGFRHLFKRKLEKLNIFHFWGIGIVTHLVMLASQLLIMEPGRLTIIQNIWLPVLVTFPLILAFLSVLFQAIGRYIESERKIHATETMFRTTLQSIGDAVISTDIEGYITHMNPVAEKLTGWKLSEAFGQHLEKVFRIISEETHQPVESPFKKVISEGTVVGLANHTLLITKKGREIPIADSGAPIKNEQGEITGMVLVFRDQTLEREAQRKIRESEEKFRKAFQTSPDAININRLDGLYVEINEGFTTLTGFTRDDVIGKLSSEIKIWAIPEDRDKLIAGLLENGVVENLESKFRCKDGSIKTALMSARIVMLNNESHILSITRDISEIKKSEIEIREREFWLTESQKAGRIGSYDFDIINNHWISSEVLDELFGIGPENPRTLESWNAIIHPEHRQVMLDYFLNEVIGKKKRFDKDYKIIRQSDGAERWVLGRGELTFDENGNPVRMYGTIQDITERKLYEMQLRESEERFRKSVLMAPIPVMVHDEDGIVLSISEGWTHFSGYTIDDIPTLKDWMDKAYGPKAREIETYFRGLYSETKTIFSGEFEINTKSGDKRIWYFYSTPLGKFSNGKRLLLNMAPDITQRKRVQQELIIAKEKAEESERLKSAFLANMSHEIRTPLNGILGFTNILTENENLSGEEKREYASVINKSAEGLLKIINDILDISRLETGKAGIEPKLFDAGDMLNGLKTLFAQRLTESGKTEVELILQKPQEKLVLNTDENRLIQIFSNLLDNALRFTKKGNITFGVAEIKDGKACFFVSDTGAGIPKEKHEIIFDRFSQADNYTTRSYGGTGLGLAIVRKLLEMMGSEISLESEPGKGARFSFRLPVETGAAPQSVPTESPVGMAEKINNIAVMIVEDDAASRIFFKHVLSERFDKILIALTGKEALQLFEAEHPEIILLDIGLPDINGLEIVRQIRKKDQSVYIIAQTAYAMPGDKQKALDAGCDDYIVKPVKTELLLEKISMGIKSGNN